MNRNSRPGVLDTRRRDSTYPPDKEGAMLPDTQAEEEKLTLLHKNGFLFGYRMDDIDGPRRSTLQVAHHKSGSPIHATETNRIDTEIITATHERQTNYVQKGWSLAAISESVEKLWTLSRIAKTNTGQDKLSLAKRVVLQRLRVEMLLENLKPVPEFESDILAALESPTSLQKFCTLNQVFEHWGDVIPLVFDIGVSLTVTDGETSASMRLASKTYQELEQLVTSGKARASTQGGDPTLLGSKGQAWIHRSVPPSQWAQVRVVKVAPTTSLLDPKIQSRLSELYNTLIAYSPVTLPGVTSNGRSFDDTSHARKTIASVTVCCDNGIKSITVTYRDGSKSDTHGGTGGGSNEFKLTPGEYITELVIWRDAKTLYAIQMVTDTGRSSNHYGKSDGTPTVLRSNDPGGCLTAFSGIIKSDYIYQLQAIWRHDIKPTSLSGERYYSDYFGGAVGSPFNDWGSVKHDNSVCISSIRVKCGAYVAGIQVTYNHAPERSSSYHGGLDGQEHVFKLEPGEHIVTIIGRWNKYIVQLCFVTNQGRASDVYGGGNGEAFVCRAPRTRGGMSTRLHYIMGKSGDWLNGLLFVWVPL